jgi:DNA gyrase/topoisomerase IV subunit A
MVISQFGKIIRIETKSIRAAGRSTQGVKLLDLEPQDKVAAAVDIPPEEAKTQPEEGTLIPPASTLLRRGFSLPVRAYSIRSLVSRLLYQADVSKCWQARQTVRHRFRCVRDELLSDTSGRHAIGPNDCLHVEGRESLQS